MAREFTGRRFGVPAILGALIVVALLAPASSSAAGCSNARATPGTASAEKLRKAVVCLINRARASQQAPKLTGNSDLDDLAQRHTKKMVAQNCFKHQCQDERPLKRRFRRSAYVQGSASFRYGEELGYESTPREMVRRWLKSAADRGNLLDQHFEDIGVGVKRGAPQPGVRDRKFETYTVDLGALQSG